MNQAEIEKQTIAFRRHFHQYPEVSTQEFQTQAYIQEVLTKHSIAFKSLGTGTVATIGQGERCVALRADMDALWVSETTGLPYASQNPGVMHACGHDFHMAMVWLN